MAAPLRHRGPPAELAADSLARKRAQVLTKATVRVAGQLGLAQAELARVLGISTASVSRMFKDEWTLPPESKPWELAALLVRIFRSLDALVGGDEKNVQAWFHAENVHLGGVPADLVSKIEGLTRVAGYLDALRGAQ